MTTESTSASSLLGAGHNHSKHFNPEARTKESHINTEYQEASAPRYSVQSY